MKAFDDMMGNALDNLTDLQRSLKFKTALVTIYQVDYTVLYTYFDDEIEIQSINDLTDIEDVFKDRFVTMVIDKIEEQIREEKAGAKDKGDFSGVTEGDR